MEIRVYEYEGCSTCRNALKWLDAKGVAYERVPIVDAPPSVAELKKMKAFVGDLKRLFNTSGVLYREMKVGDKLKTMSEAGAFALLSKHGKLVKRPFVLLEDRGLLGFKEAEWSAALRRMPTQKVD